MKMLPDAKVQNLSECRAGQLVRNVGYGGDGRIGIVFDGHEGEKTFRGLVEFEETGPEFSIWSSAEELPVLAYSANVILEVDPSGPLETRAGNIFDKIGALIADKDGWVLNLARSGTYGRRARGQLRLPTGKLENYRERYSGAAIFGAWSISLEDPDRLHQPRQEMVRFCIGSEE